MSEMSNTTKALMAIMLAGTALVGCERRDADQAAADTQSPMTQSRSASASADMGTGSSGASGTSSGASGSASSAGRAIDDSVITTKAKTALLADTTVKGTDIDVETNQGIVTLSGMVEDSRQKERAASIIKGIDGVKSVENNVTLKK